MSNFITQMWKKNLGQKNNEQNKTKKISDDEAKKKVIDYLNKNEGEEAVKAISKGEIKVANMGDLGLTMVSFVRYFFVNENGVEETKELNEGDIINYANGKIDIQK